MDMPRVKGNWQGVVNRIDGSTDEIRGFFDPVSELIEHYRWEVSIGYMFTRVEQAHNHLLRGSAIKYTVSTAEQRIDLWTNNT